MLAVARSSRSAAATRSSSQLQLQPLLHCHGFSTSSQKSARRRRPRGTTDSSRDTRLGSLDMSVKEIMEMESSLAIMRLMFRGYIGGAAGDFSNIGAESQDLYYPILFPRFGLPKLAKGNGVFDRLVNTKNTIINNWKLRFWWFRHPRGFNNWFKNAYYLQSLCASECLYKAPSRPAWTSLPSSALGPSLLKDSTHLHLLPAAGTNPHVPPTPKDLEPGGQFIPIQPRNYEDPSIPRTIFFKARMLFNFLPLSLEALRTSSVSEKGTEWIGGYRWSALESYLRSIYALSLGDKRLFRRFAVDRTTPHTFDDFPRMGKLMHTLTNKRQRYVWKFHGVPEDADSPTGARILGIRSKPMWESGLSPPRGKADIVQILVAFDTLQSLEIYQDGKPLTDTPPEIHRVKEEFILEKRLFSPLPFAVKLKVYDRFGGAPQFEEIEGSLKPISVQ